MIRSFRDTSSNSTRILDTKFVKLWRDPDGWRYTQDMEMTLDSSITGCAGMLDLLKNSIDTKTMEALVAMRLMCDIVHAFPEKCSEDSLNALRETRELTAFIAEISRLGMVLENLFEITEKLKGSHRIAYHLIARRKMMRAVEEFSDMVLFMKAFAEEPTERPVSAEELLSRIA